MTGSTSGIRTRPTTDAGASAAENPGSSRAMPAMVIVRRPPLVAIACPVIDPRAAVTGMTTEASPNSSAE